MKNTIFTFFAAAFFVILLSQVAGADYPWIEDPSLGVYTNNESDIIGLDEMSETQLRDMILNRINWTENNPDYVFIKSEPADDMPLLRGYATPSSASWTQNNLTYTINGTNCIISKYNGGEYDLLVPNTTIVDGVSYHTVLNDSVFMSNNNITSISFDDGVSIGVSTYRMFQSCTNISAVNFTGVNFSNTQNLNSTFRDCVMLTNVNMSGIDTSNVTNFGMMFFNCRNLTTLDISGFNTSKSTTFSNMFSGCNNLTTLDVSGFNTSKSTTFSGMFSECNNLTTLDVSGFNTSNSTDFSDMFSRCNNLTTLDVSGFETSNVTNMLRMFQNSNNLTTLNLSTFNTTKCTNMGAMFQGCSNLSTIDLSSFVTSNVTQMSNMFGNCRNLTTLNVSTFNTSKCRWMSGMFESCAVQSLNLSGFDTSNVTEMQYMFNGCKNMTYLDVSNLSTQNVTSMQCMFCNCSNLTDLDLASFDTRNVTNMRDMFSNSTKLHTINTSTFNTTKVTTMRGMFNNLSNVTTVDLSGFDTHNVTDFSYMFNNTGLYNVNVSTFNTSKATTFQYMFSYNSNLSELNLSSFDVGNVSGVNSLFLCSQCSNLQFLDVHTFHVPSINSPLFLQTPQMRQILTPETLTDNTLSCTGYYWHLKNSTIDTYSTFGYVIANGTMTRAFNTTAFNPTGATISVQPHAAWNSSVPLSATLSDGYIITSWNVTDQNGNSIEVTNDSFAMPFSNVTVRANTERPQFSVTVVQPTGATISASSSTAYYNDTITLSSNAQTGYVFNSWNVTDENGTTVTVTGNTFRMPMSNVTVRANIDHPLYNLTVVQPSAGGTIAASSQTAYYGDTINLTSNIQTGYRFNNWNVTTTGGQTVSVTNNSFTMPASNVNIRANITHVVYSVNVIQPTGATISASPGSGFYGDTVTLTSTSQTGYRFLGWNVTTAGGQTVTVTGNTFTLPADNVTVRANIEHIQYTLTVIPTTGITITAPATAYYLNAVTLNKTVSTGYRFLGWNVTTAGGQSVSVSGDSFTMPPDNVTIQALGEKIVYNITELQPEGGSVLANRSNATYGDQVSLTSVPSIGYRFSSWNVTADGVPVTVTGNTFSMPAANVTVSAVYEKIVYNVNITTNTAGTITTNRSNATYGDLVSVSASPVIGYNFESWNVTTDSGQQVSVTNDSFVMPAANVSVAAVFSSATYTVTVAQTTGGNTTVSQSAANPGTVIWITAEPDSGYIITNYAVISEGGDSIFVENSAFAMPASNVTASVTYSVIQPQFTTTPGISFTPTNIVLNYTSNARSNDYPEFIWEASADNFTTIDNSGTVSGINGSIAFSSNRTSGNLTIRMRPVVGTEWTSITISLSTEVIINIVDGVDGTLISTGTRFTSVGGLVTPSAAVVNAVLNNSTMMITTSGGNTTRMRTWSTTINASAGENLTFTYTGGLDSPWANVTYVVTIPSTNMLNITLPRQESGYAGTIIYYTDGGQPVAGIPVAVYDSSYNDLGTITTYAGGQAVYQTDDFAAVYFDVNTSGYTTNTKVVPIPSHDSVYLSKTRTITIRVMDATGGQFVPAFTTYLGDQEVMKSTDNGSVVYSNVEDGTYSVIVSASGFYQVTREITVDEQNTDFVLNITQQNSTTFTSQNFVRLIYTDIFGNKMPGLTIKITENNTEVFTGITGADGSVSMIMNQTRLYQITATNSQGTVVNTLSLWPQYSEYAIIVKSSANEAPPIETAQLDIYWKTDLVSINASTSRLNLSMKNANENQNVTFTATLKNNTTALNFTSGIIEYGTTTTVNFTVPNANETYLLEVTYTDENGNSRTVTTTIQTNLNEMKMKYEIPGFSEQWHYDALCVLLILVTSFLFSQQTKHIGGIIIPLEAAGLYAIGWLRYSGFAICMLVAVVIMALILFVERMDRD